MVRSLNRVKPFSDKGDKGFKDTLIWLSILDDAKVNKNINYIFCSQNTNDFEQGYLSEEFKLISKSKFIYLTSISELKEYLDGEVKLNLKLKENNEKIEQELKQRIGDIMVKFNYYKSEMNDFTGGGGGGNLSLSFADQFPLKSRFGTIEDKRAGYNFKDISVSDINEIKKDVYLINANLTVKEIYINNQSNGSWVTSLNMSMYNNVETYDIDIKYDKKLGIIDINHINRWPTFNLYVR